MAPSAFVTLEKLPLTANGKVDRKALPAPEWRPESIKYVAPRTPMEEKLVDIWSEVLGIDQVGIHDNFFELGGDSIQSMKVIVRAGQVGIKIATRHTFTHQTVAELATVAQLTDSFQAEQGVVQGEAPLTPIQRWFFEEEMERPDQFSQTLLLESDKKMLPELLEQAVKRLMTHHDALRLRYYRSSSGWRQRHAEHEEDVLIERYHLSMLEPSLQSTALKRAVGQLQSSLNLTTGPLLRVALFDSDQEKGQLLLLVAHHLVVDAVSWRILGEDLRTIYGQLEQGHPVHLPSKTTSFKQWSEKLTAYARSANAQEEVHYWLSLPWEKSSRLPVDHRGQANETISFEIVTGLLSAAETEALLREVPRAYQTQINNVLLTALAKAFSRWTGNPHLLINLVGHGRGYQIEEMDVSRTVGWFTSTFPVLLDVSGAGDIETSLKNVKEQLQKIPHQGIGYGVLRYLTGENLFSSIPEPEIQFNYLGQRDRHVANDSPLQIVGMGDGMPQNSKKESKILIRISGLIVDGRLQLQWIYPNLLYNRATIDKLSDSFLESLRLIIAQAQRQRDDDAHEPPMSRVTSDQAQR
jgi:non-ribosomal peptide synthase protein (TIGR01720 family)